MTDENFNTLSSLKDRMERLCIHGFHKRVDDIEQQRIQYLCGEFGLNPVDWNCQACVKARVRTLYEIYKTELKRREDVQA